MRRELLLLTVAAAVCAAPAAQAKGLPVSAKACGADGCRTLTDRDDLAVLVGDGTRAAPPAGGAPFVTLEVRAGDDRGRPVGTAVFDVLPAAGLVRFRGAGDPRWLRPSAKRMAALRGALDGVRPFPAARLPEIDGPPRAGEPGGPLAPVVYGPPAAERADGAGGSGGIAWWTLAAGGVLLAGLLAGLARRLRGNAPAAPATPRAP